MDDFILNIKGGILLSHFLIVCVVFPLDINAQILINEVCASNSQTINDDFGRSADWVELFNAGPNEVSLKNWFLSDDETNLHKWRIPEISIAPNTHAIIFANKEDTWLQFPSTNFKLSSAGETISLSTPDSLLVDQVNYPAHGQDRSWARMPDASQNWQVQVVPTPLTENTGPPLLERIAPPEYPGSARFFTTSSTIELQSNVPGAQIYYTTDGNIPTTANQRYTGPIRIDKSVVIKAIAVVESHLPSSVSTFTFFVEVDHQLPVLALSTSPYNFWDYEEGILIQGGNAQPTWPYWGANYWSDKEVPVYMEYFEDHQKLAFSHQFDTRVHGGRGARTNPQKPFRLLTKKKYGDATVSYPFFKDRTRTTYKRLVLRNASGDYNNAHFRDAFLSRYFMKEGLNLDVMAYQPVAIYLNGKYYGVINMREKSDEHYLANNYGVDIENLDLLEEDTLVNVGNYHIFDSMYQFVFTNDLRIETNYEKATTFFDVENLAETFIVELCLNNNDWLGNNIKYWRERKENARWRYLVFDMDIAMGRHGWTTYDYNLFEEKMADPGTNRHINIFKSFLNNTTFRNYFLNRHADILNTSFKPEQFSKEIDRTAEILDFDMQRHFDRWPICSYTCWKESRLPILYEYVDNRPTHVRQHLIDYFELQKEVALTLNTFPEGAGKIKINTIIPDQLPWAGIYFDGVPVTLTIEAEPGYTFSHWQSFNTILDKEFSTSIAYNFEADDEIIAYFETDTKDITIVSTAVKAKKLEVTLDLTQPSTIEMTVYDVQGRTIKSIPFGLINGGRQRVVTDFSHLADGVYFLKATDGKTTDVTRFVMNN